MTETAFDVTRRGYDRDQVDDRLRALTDRLAAAEEARRQESDRASRLESRLAEAGAAGSAPAAPAPSAPGERGPASPDAPAPRAEGFGARAEKVLRLAEELAADLRSQSAEEAAALVESARADAESHRHEVEQTLIARAAQQDQEAARRQVELREREQQLTAQLAAAREKAEEIRAGATREAEQLRQEARAEAAALRMEAANAIRADRDAAQHELSRVGSVRDSVRAEMTRLHEVLSGELGHAGASPSPDDAAEPRHDTDEFASPSSDELPAPRDGRTATVGGE